MQEMNLKNKVIGVCGAGTMGRGIALAAAQSGFNTWLYDLHPNMVSEAKAAIEKQLQGLADKQKITVADKEAILSRITFSHDLSLCKADIIIEAIIETTEAKKNLFQALSQTHGEEVIFASNTSSLSITALQQHIPAPQRFAGMHFFNPATLMKLVEVVEGKQTDPLVIATLMQLAKAMHKTPVRCKDAPGFIVNRVARPYYLEALRMLESGIADMATIDALMEASGFRMGPFRLMDLIGNDINYAVSCSVYEQMGKPERLKPSAVQENKVREGNLGRKTGKGYYSYE